MSQDFDELLKRFRKKPLADIGRLRGSLDVGIEGIKKIVPHREPLLFVDRLTGLDLLNGTILGVRRIPLEDPVFRGHFPGYPLYPGTFIVEMIGQLGLCLRYFLANNTDRVDEGARPVAVRVTRILGALFLDPVLPGKEIHLLAQKLESDGLFDRFIGQAISDGRICCVTAGEVYLPG